MTIPRITLPPVVGHRGAAAVAPENTLASIRAAAKAGAKAVEFDVMLTGDDEPVLFHDDKLDRITGQDGLTAQTSWSVLKTLDAGAWQKTGHEGERIPHLDEAVALLDELNLQANVEIKPSAGRAVTTAEVVVARLKKIWPKDKQPPLISSFKREALAVAKLLAPDWPRALLVWGEIPEDWAWAIKDLACEGIHPWHELITEENARAFLDAGLAIRSYTVNEAEIAKRLWSWGVQSIITDNPGAMLGVS